MIRQILLGIFGIFFGSATAAGVFSFLIAIGLIQRIADKTQTIPYIKWYETAFVFGGSLGNVFSIYSFPLAGGPVAAAIIGVCYGIFIGCLIMSLAETLNVLPVFTRRIGVRSGLPWIVAAFAAGKAVGSFFYFFG